MADLNLNELRKVAEAATPGPWVARDFSETYSDGSRTEAWSVEANETPVVDVAFDRDYGSPMGGAESADARHIATFDPPTVLALLDRVAELEAVVGRVEALCAGAWWTGEVHRDDIRAALAKPSGGES